MKKVVLLIALVVLLVTGGFGYYKQFYVPAQAAPAPTFNTTKVRSGDISIIASGVGSVLPGEKVSIGFQTSGVLAEMNVKVGDIVEAGQVLARLDDADAQLDLYQAELAYNTFYSPNSVQEAEITRLTAKADLKDAELQLAYLISGPAYYWETALEIAQVELERLKSTAGTSDGDLQQAQKAVEKAQIYLKAALTEYYVTYVWEVFSYSYVDETSGETIDTYLEPTKDEIALARLKVASAKLALKDAEDFLQALQAEANPQVGTNVSYSGTNLAKLDQAKIDVERARRLIEKTLLKAPVSGTVTAVSANAGQAVGTTSILTIETLDQMALRFYIEESDIHLVKIGNPVRILFEAYPEQPVEGFVTYLEPAIQTFDGNPAAAIWAALPTQLEIPLLSGMSAEVELVAGEAKDTLLVPVQALRELAPDSYAVFVVQSDESLKMTPVTVGLKDYANAQILSGLKAGDVVSTGAVETK